MRIDAPALVCAVKAHGEHGAVVRLMTERHGLQAAYVRGARGRRMRAVLIPGNRVLARLSARTDTQLAHAEVELDHSLAPLIQEPLPAAAVEWLTTLTATTLPEGQPYPGIYLLLEAVLQAVEAAPSASAWGAALVRYELLLLAELGFGLDLDRCVLSGSTCDLVAVSPRSGRAVSSAEAAPYRQQLLPLPQFLQTGGPGTWPEILQGLELTGHFLVRDLLTERTAHLADTRERLVERMRRAAAPS